MDETSTTNLTLNGSVDLEEYLPDQCSTHFPYTLIAFAGVGLGISLCGLVGNGMVMLFLGFHMKQNPFTVYTLNLAVADFSLLLLFFLLILAFLTLAAFCTSLFHLTPLYIEFVFAVELLWHLFDLSSLGLLTALSLERCVSILCPIWYQSHCPRHLSGVISGSLWVLPGVLVSSLYFTFTGDSETILAGVALVISLILSVGMLVSNLFLFLKLCCGSQRWQPGKPYVTILLNILLFFAFSIPFCLEVLLNLSDSGELFPQNSSLLLALLNSSLNPVIYVLVGSCQRHFPCSIKLALQTVFEGKSRSEEGSHSPGDTAGVEVTAL